MSLLKFAHLAASLFLTSIFSTFWFRNFHWSPCLMFLLLVFECLFSQYQAYLLFSYQPVLRTTHLWRLSSFSSSSIFFLEPFLEEYWPLLLCVLGFFLFLSYQKNEATGLFYRLRKVIQSYKDTLAHPVFFRKESFIFLLFLLVAYFTGLPL